MDFNKLKENFEKLRQKYGLPEFDKLNNDFDIEKLQENDTDFLLREIRRAMLEKNMAYLRFIEMFLNPNNTPMFLLVLIRSIDNNDKKYLNDLYLELGRHELKSLSLDNFYEESREADFIKMFYERWQEIKIRFGEIIDKLDKSLDNKQERKAKGYLG